MAIQLINTGTGANKGDGDSLRSAFTKINNNFTELTYYLGSTVTDFTEIVEDVVGSMLIHGDHTVGGIKVDYNDTSSKIIINLITPAALVPPSGSTGTVLTKNSIADFDTTWTSLTSVVGPTGPTGPSGSGIVYLGAWNSATIYAENDVVNYQNGSYISTSINYNSIPTNLADWDILALPGSVGPQASGFLNVNSTDSHTIVNSGELVFFTTYTGAFVIGGRIRAVAASTTSNWVEGDIVDLVPDTRINIIADHSNGSGTYDSWDITVAGHPGIEGTVGPTGPAGPQGPGADQELNTTSSVVFQSINVTTGMSVTKTLSIGGMPIDGDGHLHLLNTLTQSPLMVASNYVGGARPEILIRGYGGNRPEGLVNTSGLSGLILESSRGTESSPSAIQANDVLGYVGFGGFDTNRWSTEATLNPGFLASYATETWNGTTNTTTNAGTGFILRTQPNGVQLNPASRQIWLQTSWQNGTATEPPQQIVRIGNASQSTPTLLTSNGQHFFAGFGAANIEYINVKSKIIGVPEEDYSVFEGDINGITLNVTTVTSGFISVGQHITGTNILTSTFILSTGTGVGGTGTYFVSKSQTVSSTNIRGGSDNNTLQSTNVLTFITGRKSGANGRRSALKKDDTIFNIAGKAQFLEFTLGEGATVADLRFKALENYTTSTRGSAFIIGTVNSGTTATSTRLDLSDQEHKYRSDRHYFTATNATLTNVVVEGHVLPAANSAFDLGTSSTQWRSLYVGTSTIYLGGTALSVSGGNLTVDGAPVSGGGGASLGDRLTSSTYSVILEGNTGTVSVPNSIISQGYQLNLAGSQYSYDVGRYLRVRDGDFESHLHLDTPDNSLYDIILGDDNKFVRVDHTGPVVIGTFDFLGSPTLYNTWTFEVSGNIILPNLQSIDSSDPTTLIVGTADAKLTLDSFNQAALLQAKKSFVRNFSENYEANFSYTNAGGQGTISITLTGNGLYLRTLLQRLADQFSGNLQFPYSYSNIQATVNPSAENIVTAVTNVIQGFGPNDYVMEVNQLPDPDPFTFTDITITYDYLNTVGVDVDKDIFGISTDNDDIDITSGRDINLRATDDLRLTAGSYFELELSQLDGQENTDGLEIRVGSTLTTHSWMYRFDGVTQLPSGLTASPLSNFVPVSGTAIQQNENEILQVVSKGLSGGMTVGWAENPFEPSKVAALTFNATAEQVRIATGSYTGTVNTWAFDQTGIFTTPQGAAIGPEGMGWPGFSNGVSGLPLSIVNKNPDGLYLSNITLYASGSGNVGIIEFTVWNTETVVSKTITINTAGNIVLPGGGVIDGSDHDVEITASNDGSSTFGSVTINTQGPPAIYTVVQQTSPYSPDTITTDIGSTPFIGNIVAGMTVTGSGIVVPTTVSAVTGPDIYGTYSITISPPSGTGLNYTETYTFTSAGGVTNRNWEFNSLGELYLPQGGAIQETEVTNELWGTTTTSLTLVPAGAANGTQRLEIYSTGGGEGNHIHITSGDQTQTDLFLGNDTQYFAVAANGQNYIQARNGYASPNPGTSAGPGANVNIYAGNAGDNGGNVADGNSGGDIFIASGISTSGLGGDILLNTSSGPDGFGSIELSTDGGSSTWTFNKDNELVFPNGTTQTTAYGFVSPPVSSTSTGVAGALAKDASYFYVCTATNAWQRIAWDNTPW